MAATNFTAFPATNSDVGVIQCHMRPSGIGGIMGNHPRSGTGVGDGEIQVEEEAMASLCRDIHKQKRAQSGCIRMNIDLSRDKCPQNGLTAWESLVPECSDFGEIQDAFASRT